MDNWNVFLIIVEIVAFLSVFVSFTSKLSQALGEFRTAIEQLKDTVADIQQNSRKTHKEIFDKLDDHETRISHLEK